VLGAVFLARNIGALEGDIGRNPGPVCSASRMNFIGVNGDPDDEIDLIERGLWPLGVDNEKDGTKGPLGSGVRGGSGGVPRVSGASSRVAELIHLSSWAAGGTGESVGMNWKRSAK